MNNSEFEVDYFDDFHGPHPYVALSNFYVGDPIECTFSEQSYMTGEHMFQCYKTTDFLTRQAIIDASSPGVAKAIGRSIPLRPDWEMIKYDVMRYVLSCKFMLHRKEGNVLQLTGDKLLVEGTEWSDTVWGIDINESGDHGRNWLGVLLMTRRAELRAEAAGAAPFLYDFTFRHIS